MLISKYHNYSCRTINIILMNSNWQKWLNSRRCCFLKFCRGYKVKLISYCGDKKKINSFLNTVLILSNRRVAVKYFFIAELLKHLSIEINNFRRLKHIFDWYFRFLYTKVGTNFGTNFRNRIVWCTSITVDSST